MSLSLHCTCNLTSLSRSNAAILLRGVVAGVVLLGGGGGASLVVVVVVALGGGWQESKLGCWGPDTQFSHAV